MAAMTSSVETIAATSRCAARTPGLGLRAAAATLALLASGAAVAQEAPAERALALELNALQPSQDGCRFTFLIHNGLGDISRAAFELVFFNGDGLVERLAVVDFKDLPEGKTRVRQFDFSGLDCGAIGRVLVNDVAECAGAGVAATDCLSRLTARTRADLTFGT
jgi:hypothetical protein